MSTPRPLSPHLGIYKWLITNTLSILHRITGFGLAIGTLLLVLWLYTAAYSPEHYYDVQAVMSSVVGRLFMLGWTLAFFYHLSNGIRHLMWDTGAGFELKQVTSSGIIVLVFTVIMTAASWWLVFCTNSNI